MVRVRFGHVVDNNSLLQRTTYVLRSWPLRANFALQILKRSVEGDIASQKVLQAKRDVVCSLRDAAICACREHIIPLYHVDVLSGLGRNAIDVPSLALTIFASTTVIFNAGHL